MSDAALAEAPLAAPPSGGRATELEGLVDNATSTRMFGWAWNATRPEERVTVELRLGEEVVATTLAERERQDLVKAGVGDGRHAFELPLTPEWVARRAEMSVVVRAADGSEHSLPLRIRRADVDPSGSIQRVLEATASAHRQLREELRRIAGRLPSTEVDPAQEEAIRTLALGQTALLEKLDTLTLWLTRLDERLAALPAAAAPPPPRRRLDGWQGVLLGTLFLLLLLAGLGTAALLLPVGG